MTIGEKQFGFNFCIMTVAKKFGAKEIKLFLLFVDLRKLLIVCLRKQFDGT